MKYYMCEILYYSVHIAKYVNVPTLAKVLVFVYKPSLLPVHDID